MLFCIWNVPALLLGLGLVGEVGRGGGGGVQRFHHVKSCQTCWEPQSAHLKLYSQNKFV